MSGASNPPNLTDYSAFIYGVMRVTPDVLPTDSPAINWTFQVAMSVTNSSLACVGGMPGLPSIYAMAVYNLGGDYLINWAPDQDNQTYFEDLRTKFGINTFVPGVITSSGDQATNESMLTPDTFKLLTMSDLQNLKTPYGRQYMAFAQRYGTLWGLS